MADPTLFPTGCPCRPSDGDMAVYGGVRYVRVCRLADGHSGTHSWMWVAV